MHFYLLAQINSMTGKVIVFLDRAEREASDDKAALRLALKRLDPFPAAQLLAAARLGETAVATRMMTWTTLAIGPVLLLLFTQIRFLPFHDALTTWVHRGLICLDLALIWWLWPRAGGVGPAIRPAKALGGIAGGTAVLFSSVIATIPDEYIVSGQKPLGQAIRAWMFDGAPDHISQRPTSLFSRSLILPDEDFVPQNDDQLRTVHRTLVLRGRDFQRAVLDRVDLRRADLTGANLSRASLVSSQLDWAILERASLVEANLDRAHLRGAILTRANASGGIFDEANLSGAVVEHATLTGASFRDAQLVSVALNHSILDGANLARANLADSTLFAVQLRASLLDGVSLQGAFIGKDQYDAWDIATSLEGAYLWRVEYGLIPGTHDPFSGFVRNPNFISTPPRQFGTWENMITTVSPYARRPSRRSVLQGDWPEEEINVAKRWFSESFDQPTFNLLIVNRLSELLCGGNSTHFARGIANQFVKNYIDEPVRNIGEEGRAALRRAILERPCPGRVFFDRFTADVFAALPSL